MKIFASFLIMLAVSVDLGANSIGKSSTSSYGGSFINPTSTDSCFSSATGDYIGKPFEYTLPIVGTVFGCGFTGTLSIQGPLQSDAIWNVEVSVLGGPLSLNQGTLFEIVANDTNPYGYTGEAVPYLSLMISGVNSVNAMVCDNSSNLLNLPCGSAPGEGDSYTVSPDGTSLTVVDTQYNSYYPGGNLVFAVTSQPTNIQVDVDAPEPSSAPEPTTATLLLSGLGALACIVVRKFRP